MPPKEPLNCQLTCTGMRVVVPAGAETVKVWEPKLWLARVVPS